MLRPEIGMLKTLRLIQSDLRAKAQWSYDDDGWRSQLRALAADGSAAMVVYRAMQAARRYDLPAIEMLMNKVNSALLGCVIGRGAEFGPRFVLIHSNGVVINGMVRGGSGVHIEHQVTIGAEKRQSPVLGNNLFIGAGAKILGTVTISDNARIGANAVVTRDVMANVTVVGVPAKPIASRKPACDAPGNQVHKP
jgi:serine O-acetyltransferase